MKISGRFRSTARTILLATYSGSTIMRSSSRLPSTPRWGKPGVSTNPGLTVCTRMPSAGKVAASAREKATSACFVAEYGPGGTATVPATDAMLTTWAGPPPADAPGISGVVHEQLDFRMTPDPRRRRPLDRLSITHVAELVLALDLCGHSTQPLFV